MPRAQGPAPEPLSRDLPEVLAPLREDLLRVGERYESILGDLTRRTQEVVGASGRFAGKRLRPALSCLGARIAGGVVDEAVATVAAVVEMIHTATLVHDDVLDGAVVRRRVATLNARWGDGIAVLAGDVLFSRAYLAAARLEDRFASRYLSEVVGEVLEGEIHQDLVSRDAGLDEEEYRRIVRGKTAALYEAALVVGAHHGGGDAESVRVLGRAGHHLGMAFQMVDDRLDLTGDEATVGKTLGRDLGEGKTTLPVILWQRSRAPAERARARALVEAAWDDTAKAIELARRVAEDGALEATDHLAEAEVASALSLLDRLVPSPDLDLLRTIARFVLSRRL